MPIMVRTPVALSLLGLNTNGVLTVMRTFVGSHPCRFSSTAQRAMNPYPKTVSFTASLSMNLWLSHSSRRPQPIVLAAEGNLPRRAESSSSSSLGAAASCWFPHDFLLWRETKNASCAKPLPHSFWLLQPRGCIAAGKVFPPSCVKHKLHFLLPISCCCSFSRVLPAWEATSPLHTQHLLLSLQPACPCLL